MQYGFAQILDFLAASVCFWSDDQSIFTAETPRRRDIKEAGGVCFLRLRALWLSVSVIQNTVDNCSGRIVFVIAYEDNLVIGIILFNKSGEILLEAFVEAAARNEHGHKRHKFGTRFCQFASEKPQVSNPAAKGFEAQENQNCGENVKCDHHVVTG